MNRGRHGGNPSKPSGEKAQVCLPLIFCSFLSYSSFSTFLTKTKLVLAYQELSNELHSTQLKVIGNYTLGRIIGEGSFGTVRLGIHRLTGSRVAIKHIPKSSSPPLLTREIHHHRRLHHPNVVQLYEVIATEHSIWLITELCSGGELFDYLVEKTRFTEFEARRLFGQICLGLGYVHRKGVVHRDLKLENVLLDERCNPKLADFGFGREFEPRKLLDTFCGTTGYAAPEMLAGKKYLGEGKLSSSSSLEVDIWSLGIILHALLTGSLPFDDDDEEQMKAMIMVGHFEIPNFISNGMSHVTLGIKLIYTCPLSLQIRKDELWRLTHQDPKARPSIEKILSHPWFTTPPLLHTYGEGEPLCRPSPIIEEAQQLPRSPPTTTLATLAFADRPSQASSRGCSPIPSNDANQSSHSVLDSDASGISSKESHLSVSSGRSNTSSPVTSEDLPAQIPAIPDLGLSSSDCSAGSAKSNSASGCQPTSLLKHANSSHSTIKNSQSSIPYNPSQHLPTHAEDKNDTSPFESNFSSLNSERENLGDSSQSSNTGHPNGRAGATKPRPLSILASIPSSMALPQIRTPSRTKRRSVGSTLSERIGPFEDSPSDFNISTTNQARLSTSSLMTVVVDYVGALKATAQAPLLSQDDMTFLTSLSVLGFDMGQIIHSVQSYACDSSGALWWLLKRKKDKQTIKRYDAEAESNRNTTKDPFSSNAPLAIQSLEPLNRDGFGPTSEVVSAPNLPSSKATTVSSTNPPEDPSKYSLKAVPEPSNLSKKPTTPSKPKLAMTSSIQMEPSLNLTNVEKEAGKESTHLSGHRSYLNLRASFGSSKNNPLTATTNNFNDDARSSTSSARVETLSGSDKETPFITVDLAAPPAKKPIADQRKRSQSVSMLQRATHALGTKKSADDKHSKTRSREGSSNYDGDEKPEKISKKDIKARERESRMEEHSKISGSLPLSGLFSRKTLLLPSLPPLPASLMLHQSSGGSEKSADKNGHKPKELDVPVGSCLPASSPSTPSRRNPSPVRTKDDGDTALYNLTNEPSVSTTTPSLSGSISSFNRAPPNMPTDHPDSFSTPKPLSPGGKSNPPAPNFKTEERESLKNTSPATSSLAEIVTSNHEPSPSEIKTMKHDRPKGPKGNLFSTFRFWFNEDRRKRKQNMAMIVNYGHSTTSPTRTAGQNQSPNGGTAGSVASSSRGSEFHSRKVTGDLQALRSVSGSVVVHRRSSKGSRRSSMQSTRQLSLDLTNASKATSKRRSGSSRASFGSGTDARTPGSEHGAPSSTLSHHMINPHRGSMEGPGRNKRHDAHGRHGSISSAGSRRSAVALQLLTPHSASAMHTGYARRTSSVGTTVRRVTAPAASAPGPPRHRQPRASSVGSSVRTSLSSDEGTQLMNRRSSGGGPDDHRLHSPNNVYDVGETIEEEDDGSEENQGGKNETSVMLHLDDSSSKTDAARQSAFRKLSGDTFDKSQSRLSLGGGGTSSQNAATGGGTRTIFMAHKPHSVFGTPTQAFFARSTQSPIAGKFTATTGGATSSVLSYVNLMNSIADGPSSSRNRSSGGPKLRDVFASKAKEEGEWVDMDDDDDECGRYEGGIGQGVKSRNLVTTTADRTSGSAGSEVKSGPGFVKMEGKLPVKDSSIKNPHMILPHSSSSSTASNILSATSGNSPAAGLIGNWRGGNPRVTPTFKSVAIEEEEEEEE
ncbi:uncharacterized protein VP01_44g10 [Puccinia sorghi]|uniref:Protein kinase domain-containing protein n=1 Tax=Puccinia sorghi TaxID=27349 RepID=A0A0L6UPY2_9BASI|nr:uncharacterized protein VP01_44g10 [Puccinia sorghi]